jgi:hypothetical protein
MKKLFAVVALVVAPALFAQTVHDEIAFTRSQIQADRQAIVAATLGLTEEQGKSFWPLYREYRMEMEKPLDRGWALFTTYGQNWNSMTSDDAKKALNEWLEIEEQSINIKQKYMKKFAKQTDGVTAARFFQIDNKLDTIIRLEAAKSIPLVTAKQ